MRTDEICVRVNEMRKASTFPHAKTGVLFRLNFYHQKNIIKKCHRIFTYRNMTEFNMLSIERRYHDVYL